MTADVDHDLLNDALRRCGATWDAAQTHGLLSSRLAVAGAGGGPAWLGQILEGTDADNVSQKECAELLGALFQSTHQALSERMSGFDPLLPDDSDSANVRARGLAHWSEGYLHGLVSGENSEALKARLATEPLEDIIKDLLQITQATIDEDLDKEASEEDYVEIVEYLRVAAQLVYEELAELRPGSHEVH